MRSNFRGLLANKVVHSWRLRNFPAIVMATSACFLFGCSDQGAFVDKIASPDLNASDELMAAKRLQLAVQPNQVSIAKGETQQFRAALILPDGTSQSIESNVSWRLDTDGQLLATVNADGLLSALETGKLEVKANWQNQEAIAEVVVYQTMGDPANPSAPDPAPTVRFTQPVATESGVPVAVPRGTSITVQWQATDVTECILSQNETEVYRGVDQTTHITITGESNLRIECLNASGQATQDTQTILATTPEIELTANGSQDDIVVFADGLVAIDWNSKNADRCEVKFGPATIGSTLSGSGTVAVVTGADVHATCRDSADNIVTESIHISINHASQFALTAGVPDQIAGTIASRPVSIVFALDVTGSMAGQIDTVKSGVQEFVSELVTREFQPRLGVIPFRDKVPRPGNFGDVPEGRLELTDQVQTVKDFVSSLRASGGGDANEAALGAVEEALDVLQTQDRRPDAVKIILVVTDHPGHRGNSTTDCQLAPTINRFAGLPETDQKNIKLFYAVPSVGSSCSGFDSGLEQMTTLRQQILAAVPEVSQRGGAIPWPFAHENLVTDVVRLLEEVKPPVDLVCLNESVSLTLPGYPDPIVTRVTPDLGEIYSRYRSGLPQIIDAVLDEAEYAAFAADSGRARVDRCCVSAAAAATSDFGTCLKRVTALDESFTFN